MPHIRPRYNYRFGKSGVAGPGSSTLVPARSVRRLAVKIRVFAELAASCHVVARKFGIVWRMLCNAYGACVGRFEGGRRFNMHFLAPINLIVRRGP